MKDCELQGSGFKPEPPGLVFERDINIYPMIVVALSIWTSSKTKSNKKQGRQTIQGGIIRPDFFYFLVLGRFLTKNWIGGENKNKNIS